MIRFGCFSPQFGHVTSGSTSGMLAEGTDALPVALPDAPPVALLDALPPAAAPGAAAPGGPVRADVPAAGAAVVSGIDPVLAPNLECGATGAAAT